MTNRTVQIMGLGIGSEPATVVATVNGSQVFNSTVETIDEAFPALPGNVEVANTMVSLFTFNIPVELSGDLPMTVTVANNPVIFGPVLANYGNVVNTTGNTTTFSSSGATTFLNIYRPWPNPDGTIITDCRSNVVIDGVAQTITPEIRGDLLGTWWWAIQPGSTLSYDLLVTAGLETTPPADSE
jgi:hypothetical protein